MMMVRAAAEAVAAAACGDVAGMVARCRRQGVSAAAAAVECATAIVATRRHVDLRR
jgi:hypothetical protein